ncbi:MAG: hypothetical protein DMF64_17380 [Acidobacteria bacterium]|nr:MAG: hypothetical protein DMF64_17380 [Acidobacteriota bacterium]
MKRRLFIQTATLLFAVLLSNVAALAQTGVAREDFIPIRPKMKRCDGWIHIPSIRQRVVVCSLWR